MTRLPHWAATTIALTLLWLSATATCTAGGSGDIAAGCELSQAQHYIQKGLQLERARSYADAAFAYSAASNSVNKCGPRQNYFLVEFMSLVDAARAEYNASLGQSLDTSNRWLHSSREFLRAAATIRTTILFVGLHPDNATNRSALAVLDASRADTVARVAYAQTYNDNLQREVAASASQASRTPVRRAPAATDECEKDSLTTVSEDGAFIATLDGGRYIIDTVDRVDTSLWLESDDVVVCQDGDFVKIINGGDVAHGHIAR